MFQRPEKINENNNYPKKVRNSEQVVVDRKL